MKPPSHPVLAGGRLKPLDLHEICARLGIAYTPDLRLAAVLAEAVKRAGVAGPIAARKLGGMGGNGA